MSFASVLLAPLALLLPAAQAIDGPLPRDAGGAEGLGASVQPDDAGIWADPAGQDVDAPPPVAGILMDRVEPEDAWQVRIEQRVKIRIAPRAGRPAPQVVAPDDRDPEDGHKLRERKIGKCIPVSGLAGGNPYEANTLHLYMRDRRVLTAELERSCQARDFYSGFYLSRTKDGMLCVDRDTLLSRNGANCKIKRLRQLVEEPDR